MSLPQNNLRPVEHSIAIINALQHLLVRQEASGETQKAILGVLGDAELESLRLRATERAVLNILEDFAAEKTHLEDAQRAVLNILEDLEAEKERLQQTQEEVRRSELAARSSLREKEVLLKEVHHRVKNNLQVISSLLNLQARSLTDPIVRDIFNASQCRIQAIALVHEELYQSPDLSHVDFAQHISTLVDGLLLAYAAEDRGIVREYELSGPRLAIDMAIPCGLIVNELVSNCFKHAFVDRGSGKLRVVFRRLDAKRLELVIADDGIGLPLDLDPRATPSLGFDLVYTFAEQIGAEVSVDRQSGTTWRFEFAEHGVSE